VDNGSPFAQRDFRLLLIGQTTSQFGTQISAVAVPLLAVLTLRASAFQVGLISASSTLAFALVGLPAGAWLDRWPRRPVLVIGDVVRAVLLASIPLAEWLDALSVAQLVSVSLLAGFARVFFDVGYQSYLPSVTGKDRVLAGNSAMELLRASGQIAGPGIGGMLVSLIGAATVVLVDAGTFAVSAVTVFAIRSREQIHEADTRTATPLHRQIGEGVAFVARNRVLRSIAMTSGLSNLGFAVASAVNMIFLSRTLGLSAPAIGAVLAAGAATVMAGAACAPLLSRLVGSVRIIWLSLAVTGPLTLLGVLAQPGRLVLLVVAGSAAGEFGQIIYAITGVSVRQRLCPDRMLGRVNATMRVMIMGLFPLGALAGGVLGDVLGARTTLAVAGAVMLTCPVPVYRALRRTRDVEDLPPWDESGS
jgi:predicted MFS family arabinose efflux permease